MPAPTLLKLLTIVPGIGAAALAGNIPAYNFTGAQPAPAALMATADLFPTVVVGAGPYAAPERALPTMNGRVPFLQRVRIVYPLLPDSPDVEDGGLAPTILLGNSGAEGIPGRALIDVFGNQPLVITDGTFRVEVPAQVPKLSVAGLAPMVIPDTLNEPSKEPRAGLIDIRGAEPALLAELKQEAGLGSIGVTGLSPTVTAMRFDWQTVALTGAAVWTDVEPAE